MTGGGPEVSPNLERAAFVISIDTEMSWGLMHRRTETYCFDAEREALQRLLGLFDRHQIPATWAVVGHLMLDSCSPVEGVKHPEIVRPDYEWLDGDWFDDDPCSDLARAPSWYAPDLIDLIRAAPVGHEIASHGFSHIMAGEPGCSRESFESEVVAAKAVASDRGLQLHTLVHPRNQIGHVDVLVEQGITAYRGKRPADHPHSLWQRIVDRSVGSERTAVRPLAEDGIWNLPATILFDVDARPRTWRIWLRQVERRLQQAIGRNAMFHLWFHPHNLRDNPEIAFAALDRLCSVAARHRVRAELDTITMGELADRLPLSRWPLGESGRPGTDNGGS